MTNQNRLEVSTIIKSIETISRAEAEGKAGTETKFSGIALIKNYSAGTTSTGKPKFSGIIANKDEVGFNVWSNAGAYATLSDNTIVPGETLVNVQGTTSKFGFCIDHIEILEDVDIDPNEFIEFKYDWKTICKEFLDVLKNSGATEKAKEMLLHIIEDDKHVNQRFSREYAALSNHDNCPSGLIAHTCKCLKLYNGIKQSRIFLEDERTNDLMVVGLAIHDIGKVYEMYNGTYQKYSYVTHRTLGVEFLGKYKDYICEIYDEEFYYMLLSIIQQHHDEFGDPARTLYAYIVHLIDNMEATLSTLDEIITEKRYTDDASGRKIKYQDRYLNLFKECKTTV